MSVRFMLNETSYFGKGAREELAGEINEVLDLKGLLVYVKRGILDIESDSYILSDLIGLDVYDNTKKIGTVKDYYLDNGNTLLDIVGKKEFYIPLKSHYIKKVDIKNKKIITEGGSQLIL